jgi:hypothetical protein
MLDRGPAVSDRIRWLRERGLWMRDPEGDWEVQMHWRDR